MITTGERQYGEVIEKLLPELEKFFSFHAGSLLRAMPHMPDSFKKKIRELAEKHVENIAQAEARNPFGVPITEGGWAGSGFVIRNATNNYYLHKAFPDLVDRESVLKGLNYMFGTHPAHNLSLVSAVGARSKEVAYGMNRADFTFLPGGIVPGILILKPDFPENREDWPFF